MMKILVRYTLTQGDNKYLWENDFHFGDRLGFDSKEGNYLGVTTLYYIDEVFYAYSVSFTPKAAKELWYYLDIEI